MVAWQGDTAANQTDLLYLTSRRGRKNYIRRPDVVERIGSYLPPEFPLFHGEKVCIILCVVYVSKPPQVVIETMNGPRTGDTAEEGVTSDIFRDRQPGMINHPHRDN